MLHAVGDYNLAKPLHLDKFYYVIDSLYIRNVIRHNELTEYLGLHSRILLKILTSRLSGKIKYLLVQIGILEQNPKYSYRAGYSAKQYRFTKEFRDGPFKRIQATDLKLVARIRKAHDLCCAKLVGANPVKKLIYKSVLTMSFDSQSATEWVAATEYDKPNAKQSRNCLIDMVANRRNEYFGTDTAGRLYHALVYLARDLRQFVSWNGQALYSVDVSNCQPALHATLYAPDCREKIEYLKLVTTNSFYPFINSRLQRPFKWPEEKQLLKDDVFHYIFYGSRYSKETEMQKVFKSSFPILHGLLQEAKRYNTTDLPVAMQKREADIVLNKVAAEFEVKHRHEDTCLISIHDALVTTAEHMAELKSLMERHFMDALGFKMPVKVERLTKNVIT